VTDTIVVASDAAGVAPVIHLSQYFDRRRIFSVRIEVAMASAKISCCETASNSVVEVPRRGPLVLMQFQL
jgi:hypothetical protein